MAKIPTHLQADPTLMAMDGALIERQRDQKPRAYLGMSQIGRPCERELWYSFRWVEPVSFDATSLKRFDDGHRTEEVIARRMRMVEGIELHTIDPSTGNQIRVSDFGGHFSGYLDGVVLGLLQAPKTWHVWECKATNDTKLAQLGKLKADLGEKAALAEWDATYFAQAQAYMGYIGMSRHYLIATSPGGRTQDAVRTDADPVAFAQIKAKALRIIQSDTPRPKLSTDPAFYQCKMCSFASTCHAGKVPQVNCRTCAHATPDTARGGWHCARHQRHMTTDEQRVGCDQHRFIPALIPFAKVVDGDEAANWVEYQKPDGTRFKNGSPTLGMYSSHELRAAQPNSIGEPTTEAIKSRFQATLVEPKPAPEAPTIANPLTRPWVNWADPGRHGLSNPNRPEAA